MCQGLFKSWCMEPQQTCQSNTHSNTFHSVLVVMGAIAGLDLGGYLVKRKSPDMLHIFNNKAFDKKENMY